MIEKNANCRSKGRKFDLKAALNAKHLIKDSVL